MTKLPVRSSNLALRFYVSDGWTRELLEPLLIKGTIVENDLMDGDSYFLLDVGSSLDIDKLDEMKSKLYRRFDDHPEQTDKEFMASFNWP